MKVTNFTEPSERRLMNFDRILATTNSEERKKDIIEEFDWVSAEVKQSECFFKYDGEVFCLSEFMVFSRVKEQTPVILRDYDGILQISAFSAYIIKMIDSCESVEIRKLYC